MQAQVDPGKIRDFAAKLLGFYTGAVITDLLAIGAQTGLLAAAALGPATSRDLADRAGLHERYVREWLGGMTTGGVFSYDHATGVYTLPPEHAVCVTGDSPSNLAPQSVFVWLLGKNLTQIVDCFRHGGGVPYEVYQPEFTDAMDGLLRRIYDTQLVEGILPAASGLPERLRRGARVADIGCGTGHALNVMARAFPRSTFTGYDVSPDSVAAAVAEASALGLINVAFEALDVASLPAEPKYDLITAFDAIHDQVSPATVLRRIRVALAAGGVFLMFDFKFSSLVEENVGNPLAALYYGVSTLHCTPVSLAAGGAGLGTMWGIQLARRMLAEAGFTSVEVVDSPRPQNCLYICSP